MREPAFWWQGKNGGRLLAPIAGIYGAFAAMRLRSPGQKVGIPIICVGNLTVGGAGKTPAALTVGRLLLAENKRPFFLTRGYGGRLVGPVRVDRAIHGAADVGDEPLLLAELAPTIVARDRLAGARAAQRDGADAIVMDDGFQNPSLAKDLAILVVDGRRAIGNGRVFPAGPLRAPLEAQLARAHAVLVVGTPAEGAASDIGDCAAARRCNLPWLARTRPREPRCARRALCACFRRHRRSGKTSTQPSKKPVSASPNARAFQIITVTRRPTRALSSRERTPPASHLSRPRRTTRDWRATRRCRSLPLAQAFCAFS